MRVFVDYETYWDADFTLKKMTPAEYIQDKRFAVHGMSVRIEEHGEDRWIDGAMVPWFFTRLKTYRKHGVPVQMVTFNALFDQCITAWRYGYVPDLMIDVLGMARALYGNHLTRFSLASLAKFLQLPAGEKGDAVMRTLGLSTEALHTYGVYKDLVAYAKQDNKLMVQAYQHMMPSFPLRELPVMDLVLRCAVQPQFKYDVPLLEKHLEDVKNKKADLLAACGLQYDENGKCPELMSTAKFKTLLEGQGIVVEDKTSATGRQVPALAKTDKFMQDLLEHDDETVAALAAARLGHKSTLEETRTARFISIAKLPSTPGYATGSAPIPLRYGAAHTHRLGGDWGLNKQNMPRKSPLRKSLTVEDDEEVITADEAQIEARLSAWLAQERTLLLEFAEKLDPYGQLGAAIFGLPAPVKGDKDWRKIHHPIEGFIGKTGILGLGYGAGKDKFHTMVNSMARVSIPPAMIATFNFDETMAEKAVYTYRGRYHRMPRTWNYLNGDGMAALSGSHPSLTFGPCIITKGTIWGPNGQRMLYPGLTFDNAWQEWTYKSGASRPKLYGAKMLENITQWLSRIIVMDAAVRLNMFYGLRFALQAHDELVFVVKRVDAEAKAKLIKHEMERRPSWAPDLPLEAETGRGRNYGEAK